MAVVIPSAVEEINLLQHSFEFPSTPMYANEFAKEDFENIRTEKRFNREVSLPTGVQDWNIDNFASYLNFEDNDLKANGCSEDRLVPEDMFSAAAEERLRSGSFSSVASSMEEQHFASYGLKTYNTICMDSGSTCISADHSYVGQPAYRSFDAEETFQNLDVFLNQVPDTILSENLPSPLSSSDSNFDINSLHSSLSFADIPSPRSPPTKRSLETASPGSDLQFSPKRRATPTTKGCRKTRKEKQKEMESRVCDLESERESLKVQVKVLEEMINAHKMQLYAILQKR